MQACTLLGSSSWAMSLQGRAQSHFQSSRVEPTRRKPASLARVSSEAVLVLSPALVCSFATGMKTSCSGVATMPCSAVRRSMLSLEAQTTVLTSSTRTRDATQLVTSPSSRDRGQFRSHLRRTTSLNPRCRLNAGPPRQTGGTYQARQAITVITRILETHRYIVGTRLNIDIYALLRTKHRLWCSFGPHLGQAI